MDRGAHRRSITADPRFCPHRHHGQRAHAIRHPFGCGLLPGCREGPALRVVERRRVGRDGSRCPHQGADRAGAPADGRGPLHRLASCLEGAAGSRRYPALPRADPALGAGGFSPGAGLLPLCADDGNLSTVDHAALQRTGPWWYFPPILLLGTLPWGFLAAARISRPAAPLDRRIVFLLLWVFVPLLFFSLSQSKRPQYMLPLVPAVGLLAGALWTRRGVRAAAAALGISVAYCWPRPLAFPCSSAA